MKQISGMKLEKLVDILKHSYDVIPLAAANGAKRPLMKQVTKSFSQQKDPNGEKWAPLKYKKLKRGHKIIEGFRDHFFFGVTERYGAELRAINFKYYFKYHHTGTKYMVRRGVLPESGKSVNQNWQQPLRVGAQKAILSKLKRMGMK